MAVLVESSCYMPAAHITPAAAKRVAPATNIAVANRQLLCMERLELLDCIEPALAGEING
jgi:hypothetical protein